MIGAGRTYRLHQLLSHCRSLRRWTASIYAAGSVVGDHERARSSAIRYLSSTSNGRASFDRHLAQLPSQDPFGKIRFLPVQVTPSMVTEHYGTNGIISEPHILPFWTVMYLCNIKRGFENLVTEGRMEKKQSYMDIGCSVAAVPERHWASGLVLSDDMRMMTRNGVDSSKAADIYKNFLRPAKARLDPLIAPAFAFDYPKLDHMEKQRVSTFPTYKTKTYVETWDMLQEPDVVAVPTYRFVYKIELLGGRIGFVDGLVDSPTHRFTLNRRPGRRSTNNTWTANSSIGYHARRLFDDGLWTTQVVRQPLMPTRNSMQFSELMLRSMHRNTGLINWDDQNIISLSGGSRDAASMIRFADERIVSPLLNRSHNFKMLLRSGSSLYSNTGQSAARTSSRTNGTSKTITLNDNSNGTHFPQMLSSQTPPDGVGKPKHQVETLRDPRGHYRLLNILPTKSFIQPEAALSVALKLREQRRALAKIYHGDISGKGDTEMAKINAAYDAVRTLESRRLYNLAKYDFS